MIRSSCLLAFALLLSAHARAQNVSILLGSGAAASEVRVFDPSQPALGQTPPGLKGIALLPIDFVGRTELERLVPDRPRWIEDIPGASRLQLPAGHGSLYRYSRDDGIGGQAFGFFLVDSSGAARRVFERTGTGPALDQDPWVARIAVAPGGDSILVATTPAAGGDLLEVWLATDAVVNRTDNVAPLTFSDAGLALHRRWGVAVHAGGVLRFDRGTRLAAQAIAFTPAPSSFSGELVLSSNGAYAATTAGEAGNSLHVWAFGQSGPARRMTNQPGPVAGAGFLPESQGGPYLAISDDGSRCAWCEQVITDEAFLAELGQAPQHVTADMNFIDTLDGVGQFIFIGTQLAFMVGERSLGKLENVDQYTAELAGGSTTLVNVSLSSGKPTTPFTASTIQPDGAVWLPQIQSTLMADSDANQLISIRAGQSGVNVLLPDVRDLDWAEQVGSELVLAIRRDSGSKPRQIAILPDDLGSPPAIVFSNNDADALERPTARQEGWLAFFEKTALLEKLHLLEVGTGTVQPVIGQPLVYGPTASFTSNGELVFSTQTSVSTRFLMLPIPGSIQPLLAARIAGLVLPGP